MKSYFLIALTGVYLLIAGCTTGATRSDDTYSTENAKFTKHFDNTIFRITEKRMFSVEIVTGRKELKVIGKNAAGIVIHDSHDEDVEGADVQVIQWMSEQGRGATQSLNVKEKSGGLYILEDVNLKISGHWEMRIKVKKNSLEDSAIFAFPDVTKENIPAGKYDYSTLKGFQQ